MKLGTDHSQKDHGQNSVLITGSSGFLGSRLVRALAERKVPVVAMYYHKLPDAVTNVFPICSDMSSPELLATPLRGVDTVFHLAWANEPYSAPQLQNLSNLDSQKPTKNTLITKNLVAAGLAEKCLLQLGYAIGHPQPVSVMIDTYGTGHVSEQHLVDLVRKHFDLSPRGIIQTLDLRRPIYLKTASYGHFGRPGFAWERTDKAEALKKDAK